MKKILQSEKLFMRFIFITILFVSFAAPQFFAQTLVGWWKMDEGSGTALLDSSGNGNNGTTVGGPTWVSGVDGLAINLNGTTQYATVPDAATLDITTAITLAAWINPSSAGTRSILRKSTQGGINGYEIALSSGGNVFIRFNQQASADTYRLNSTSIYPTNTWTHVAGTYDGTTMRIYINGVLDNSIAATFTIAVNTLALGIGAQPLGATPFQGAIDDARIYNGALSETDILTLATVPPGLVSPANNATGIAVPTTLSWTPFGTPTSYRVQVSTQSDFSSTVYDQSGITTTSTLVSGLSSLTQYYWRVNATKSSVTSGWSSAWSFTTMYFPAIINNGAGYALDLNGSTDFVTVPDAASLDIANEITMSAWIKPEVQLTQRIIFKSNATTGYELFLAANGLISVRFNNDTNLRLNASTLYSANFNNWIHVAATFDGDTIKIFINGDRENQLVPAPFTIVTNTSAMRIGASSVGLNLFTGIIDEVSVWDTCLTELEIKDYMCKKLTGSEPRLVGYWRFDEDGGTTAFSETGANNGTLTDPGNDSHVWSGAPLGDESIYDYDPAGGYTVKIPHTSGDTLTATTSGGTITGIQAYRVDDNSFRTGSSEDSSWTVDPQRYWGVKVIGTGSPTYGVVYKYTNNPNITIESNLRLVKRDNISDASWSKVTATVDTILNLLTSTTDQTGTEYALASTSDPLPVELNAFSAAAIKEGIKLKWQTQTEVSNYGFEIERNDPSHNPLPGGD